MVFAVATLVVLAAVCIAVWRFSQSQTAAPPDWGRATHVQLTDQPGTEQFPTLAPDGKSFVYASRDKGNWNLFLQRVGGKNATPLTPDTPSDESQPAFSPGGDRIAFRSTREPVGIYVMEATGENTRLVVAGGHHPSWSPDGKEIAYSTDGRDVPSTRPTLTSAIWVVTLETTAKRLLTETDALQPSWSPHGRRVAYWFMPPNVGRSDIATIASGGGTPVVVTKDASTNWNPVWSPDGKRILFQSNFLNAIIDAEQDWRNQTPEPLPAPEGETHFLAWDWSPDGEKLAGTFDGPQSAVGYYSFAGRKYERVAKVEGYPMWQSDPMWLSDSRRFVFSALADIVTKRLRDVFDAGQDEIRGIGISDDDRLLYFSIYESESDIWLLDLQQ